MSSAFKHTRHAHARIPPCLMLTRGRGIPCACGLSQLPPRCWNGVYPIIYYRSLKCVTHSVTAEVMYPFCDISHHVRLRAKSIHSAPLIICLRMFMQNKNPCGRAEVQQVNKSHDSKTWQHILKHVFDCNRLQLTAINCNLMQCLGIASKLAIHSIATFARIAFIAFATFTLRLLCHVAPY